jgi:hypothetical protein
MFLRRRNSNVLPPPPNYNYSDYPPNLQPSAPLHPHNVIRSHRIRTPGQGQGIPLYRTYRIPFSTRQYRRQLPAGFSGRRMMAGLSKEQKRLAQLSRRRR